ncbi:MAG: TldD/PmbA family protein [Candidatus Altiarchaeota archaeon]|nr:TldD/PmbA family protein [Candidatus Altiarchaeota archaeon]
MEKFTFNSTSTQIHLKNGILEKCVYGQDSETVFRNFNGAWAVGTSKEKVNQALSAIKATGHLGTGQPGKSFTITPKKVEDDLDTKLTFLKWVASIMSDQGVKSDIIFVDSFGSQKFEQGDQSLEQTIPSTKLILTAIASQNGKMETATEVVAGLGGWEIVEALTEEKIIENAKLAKELLNAKAPAGGKQEVIVDPDFAGVLAHEAFGHAAEADHVVAGASILTEKIGKQVTSPLLSIVDDATLSGGFGTYGFDRDGIAPQRNVIVDKGILKTYLHDRHSAGQLGAESTGNCRGRNGQIRMSNTFFTSGDMTFEEIVESLGDGYLLIGSKGGTTSPATGFFNFTAKYGRKIENGSLGEIVRGASLLGSTLETLMKVTAVSKDLQFRPGSCGKGGEWVRVSVGGPYLKTEATVGSQG